MFQFGRAKTKRVTQHGLALVLALQAALQCFSTTATLADTTGLVSNVEFSQQYTNVTKKLLLAGIELERFSLNFRLESAKQPKFRTLRYILAQEAGSSGALAFEIVGDEQFGKGRKRPLKIDKGALHGALATTLTTSIIAGTSSGFELSSNILQMIKNKRHGYDPRTATKYVSGKLKQIDDLLAQREALVAANASDPAHERAVVEGQVLHAMRNSFVNEYSHFNADTRGYLAFQNVFYFLNASYNAVAVTAAEIAYRAVDRPHLNGTANILFIAAGGLAGVSPLVSSVVGNYVRKHAYTTLQRDLGDSHFDAAEFGTVCKRLDDLKNNSGGSLIPSLPATQRFALYTQSSDLFTKQLDNETHTMRKLEKVALQQSILGPVIGSTLMTQGILGTYGYYHYPIQPRKQISQYYYGSVVGTVGTSMAVVGNAAWLLGSLAYEHKLSKQKRLPTQLIKSRLEHLDEMEKTVQTL